MKTSLQFIVAGCILCIAFTSLCAALPRAGFAIPDSIREVTLRYKRAGNLIILPVTINDTIQINLILDTGCRNLVLFGKRFKKLFQMQPNKVIQFSGLGSGKPVVGSISLGNKVSIDAVLGENIPVIVVPNQNLFSTYTNVDGIIGYDVFIKFEIELNTSKQFITFRPAATADLSSEYIRLPMRIIDALPYITSILFIDINEGMPLDILIDTGSSLGLLLRTKEHQKYQAGNRRTVLGRGLNGNIDGIFLRADKLLLSEIEINNVSAGVIYSPWPNEASIGMEILKQYSFVLNYCKGYAGVKSDVLALADPVKKAQKPTIRSNF